jgi:vacuolar-type H+-ATPase subunit I/STV1
LEVFDRIDQDNLDRDQDKAIQSTMYVYKMFLAKEKALYKTLNMMRLTNQTLIGYFWAPVFEAKDVYDIASNSPQAC